MSPSTEARLSEAVTDVEVEASPAAAELAETMSEELELWATPVEAGLFLAGLAVSHGQSPVGDLEDDTVALGSLDEAGGPEELDHLAIVGVLAGEAGDLATVLAEELPAWIEAGAQLARPQLQGTDPVDASEALVELMREAA